MLLQGELQHPVTGVPVFTCTVRVKVGLFHSFCLITFVLISSMNSTVQLLAILWFCRPKSVYCRFFSSSLKLLWLISLHLRLLLSHNHFSWYVCMYLFISTLCSNCFLECRSELVWFQSVLSTAIELNDPLRCWVSLASCSCSVCIAMKELVPVAGAGALHCVLCSSFGWKTSKTDPVVFLTLMLSYNSLLLRSRIDLAYP